MLMGPGTGLAWAHPKLLFTKPAAQTAVASSPQLITLLFNEPVTIGESAIVQAGREVPTGPVAVAREGHFVTAQPSRALKPGTYRVELRCTTGVVRAREVTVANTPVRGVLDDQTPKAE